MILYKGPSQIDGKPIVAIATAKSRNPKIGNMLQIWILRSDIDPMIAKRSGADNSICGDCPQRHFLGGGCYVNVSQAPLTIYRAFKRGKYADLAHVKRMSVLLQTLPIRFGAYGDPAAVPFEVWRPYLDMISAGASGSTGYTHQWRKSYAQPFKSFLMASCDNVAQANEARTSGWRFFLVRSDASPLPDRTIECLADKRDMACEECKICDGTARVSSQAASVWINAHGTYKSKYSLSVVR